MKPEQRDAYTQEPIDDSPAGTMDVEIETGYDGTKPNPVYPGLPWGTLVVNARGDIVSASVVCKHDVPEEERKEKALETMRRTRRRNPNESASNEDIEK